MGSPSNAKKKNLSIYLSIGFLLNRSVAGRRFKLVAFGGPLALVVLVHLGGVLRCTTFLLVAGVVTGFIFIIARSAV